MEMEKKYAWLENMPRSNQKSTCLVISLKYTKLFSVTRFR